LERTGGRVVTQMNPLELTRCRHRLGNVFYICDAKMV